MTMIFPAACSSRRTVKDRQLTEDDPVKNVSKAQRELRDKFDHFALRSSVPFGTNAP
jgi:hypothetical protein